MTQAARASDKVGAGALAGIRVIDFSQAIVGPTATMLMADFGADVIKVEPPGATVRAAGATAVMATRGNIAAPTCRSTATSAASSWI